MVHQILTSHLPYLMFIFHARQSVGGEGRIVRVTGADGVLPTPETLLGRQEEPGLEATHIPGLPLTAWVNLGTKPNLWGRWTSVDMRLASQEG